MGGRRPGDQRWGGLGFGSVGMEVTDEWVDLICHINKTCCLGDSQKHTDFISNKPNKDGLLATNSQTQYHY